MSLLFVGRNHMMLFISGALVAMRRVVRLSVAMVRAVTEEVDLWR